MTDWDGRGLPPAARDRLERFGAGSARTSLLSASGAAGIASVGLSPVGEVMGCIVQQIGWSGWGGCGMYAFNTFTPPTLTSGARSSFAGYAPYVDALYRGYDTALGRLVEEARGLGADGVVGIRVNVERMGQGNHEFAAIGTAVRADSRVRPPHPFLTRLDGPDVAALMLAGWMPAGLVYGISVAVRHDDWATQRQSSWGAGNVEVSGYTELVTHVRADARHQLDRRLARLGADGCVGVRSTLNVWHIEPGEGHRDHAAEAVFSGTAITRFRARASSAPALSVLPLRALSSRAAAASRRPGSRR
jgi:uncharacterized protein YbjQ (UPF0145 family)